MNPGRDNALLWSIAGALLLAAAVVVVFAMRRDDDAPLPAPPPPGMPEGTHMADLVPSVEGVPVVPSALTRANVEGVAPPVVEGEGVEVEPPAEVEPTEPAAGAEGPTSPVVPPAASALQGVRLPVPIAQVLEPGASTPRPPIGEQRLDAMENMVAGQEAQIRRVEASLAEAERTGDIDGARVRRERVATLRRVHGTLVTQLERMRASTPQN